MNRTNRSKLNSTFSKLQFFQYLLFFLFIASSCSAQKVVLTRISSAERSDGKGHVIRFHMKSPVESFKLAQPLPNLIQIAFYDSQIDTNAILRTLSPAFQSIDLYRIKNGIGVVLKIKDDHFYRAQAYPDGASDDILLALTKTSRSKLLKQIETEKALAWAPKPEPIATVEPTGPEPASVTRASYNKLKKKLQIDTIILDAGHGGYDPGTTSYRGVYEKKIVLSIAKKVGHYIEKYLEGVDVVYTRDGDYFVGLKERGHIANKANGDLFVSIHANAAASSRAHGTEVYFLGLERSKTALEVMKRENNVIDLNNEKREAKITQQELFVYELANSANIAASQKLAGMISHQFKTRANRYSRGVKQARFVVLYYASMPAVLVEVGFVTNPEEGAYLTSEHGQAIIASAIFRAIRNYRQKFGVARERFEE